MFATSLTFQGHIDKGLTDRKSGVALANNRCEALARNAGLDGNYRAWLSNSTHDAKENIRCSNNKSYFRVDGEQIAASCDDLLDGDLAVPINKDANGDSMSGEVWTTTGHQGTFSERYTWKVMHALWCGKNNGFTKTRGDNLNRACSGWTSSSSGDKGYVGQTQNRNRDWTTEDVALIVVVISHKELHAIKKNISTVSRFKCLVP